MKRLTKQLALLVAGILLTTGAASGLPLPKEMHGSAQTDALSRFMQQIAAGSRQRDDEELFCSLRYSARENKIYRDGVPVGQSFAGCSVQGGRFMISTDGQNQLTPQDAARKIGCEVREENGDVTVSFPFRSKRVIVKSAQAPSLQGGRLVADGYRGLYVVEYDTQEAAYRAYQAYQQDAQIEYVDCDRTLAAADLGAFNAVKAVDPTEYSWGVTDIGADVYCAWLKDEKQSLPEIRVAVVDTGVYAEHEWLKGRILEGGAGFMVDGDGGWADGHGHGTHCSGIIASSTPDNVKILPIKVLSDEGFGSTLEVYCGMMYAVEQDVDVISMSLGGEGESPMLSEAAAVMAEKDIPCCVAAGNEAQDAKYNHPAAVESLITISAIDSDHELADFSNYGAGIDFAAPGVGIISSVITSPTSTEAWNGTSMATPFAAAAVADLLSYDPTLTTEQIYSLLRAAAVDIGDPGFDNSFGWGEISLTDISFDGQRCPAPRFSPPGNTYYEPTEVTLSCPVSEGPEPVIYYTTDGTDPALATAQKYTGPIMVTGSTVIKAMAVTVDSVSRIVTEIYRIGDQEVENPFVVKDGVLVAYQGVKDWLNLADTFNDGSLKAIGAGAFANNKQLSSVVLPESVKSIGNRAFYHCDELSFIEATGVTSVGEDAFNSCSALMTVIAQPLEKIGAGAFRGCNSLMILVGGLSADVEAVPANAFRGCSSLERLDMPCVKEIGEAAFADCYGFDAEYFDQTFHFDRYEVIGERAFESAKLPPVIDLSSLREIGSGAFSFSNISEVTLPTNITELPEGVFMYTDQLRRMTAPGVTVIGKDALKRYGAAPILLEIDFSKLTDIGFEAFFGVGFMQPVVFDSLETIRPGAFDGAFGPSMSFPAVKELKKSTFSSCGVKALLFENLVTLRRGAADSLYMLAVGSSLETAEPLCIQNIDLLAGPADSPLSAYAADMETEYQAIPSLGVTERYEFHNQFGDCTLYAIPLGFTDLHVRWTDSAGNVLQDDSTGVFYADTAESGSFTYRADLMEGDAFLAFEIFKVSIEPMDYMPEATVGIDEIFTVNWDALYASADIPEEGSPYVLESCYLFRPDETGMFRLLATRGRCEVVLRGSDDTHIFTEVTDSNSEIISFYATAGQCYQIFMARYLSDSEEMESAGPGLSIFRIAASNAESLTVCTNSTLSGNLEGEEENAYFFEGEPLTPKVTDVRYYNSEFDEEVPMTEGEDYVVYYSRNDQVGFGYAIVAGIGRYYGSSEFSFQINGVVSEKKPVDLGPLKGGFASTHFVAEEDGDYAIYLDYTPEWLEEEIARGSYFKNDWTVNTFMTVYQMNADGMSTELGHSGALNSSPLSGGVFTLKKGGHYVISVGSSGLTAASVTLHVKRGASLLGSYDIATVTDGQPFDGTLAEPKVICEPSLTEGRDYTLTYLDNESIGTVLVIVQGIGSLCGTAVLTYEVFGELEEGTRLHLDTISDRTYRYRFIPEKTGTYVFYTDFPDDRIQEMLDKNTYDESLMSLYLDTYLKLFDAYDDEIAFNDDRFFGLSSISAKLTAGAVYTLEMHGYDIMPDIGVDVCVLPGKMAVTNLSVVIMSEVDPEEFGYYPEPSVWNGDEALELNQDYTLQYVGGEKLGKHLCIVTGLGEYIGRQYLVYDVLQNGISILEPIEFGEEFTVSKTENRFEFQALEFSDIRLRPTDGLDYEYSAEVYSLWQEKSWYLDPENQEVSLESDSYTLTIWQDEPVERTFVVDLVRERYNISGSDVEVSNAYYTGSPVTPEISVTFGLDPLAENVDYVVEEYPEMTEIGVYALRIIGLDKYYGEKVFYFSILPKDPSELPELTEGEYSAEITKPGQTLLYRWSPARTDCCIVSDTFLNKQFNVYCGSRSVEMRNGVGYICVEPELQADRTYVVTVSFRSPEQTGTIHFEVKSGYTDLYYCDSEYEKMVPFDPAGAVPEFTMSFDGEKLTEGKDYKIICIGGSKHYGRAEITLRGIGRYVGEQTLTYYIHPRDFSLFWRDEVEAIETLNLDEKASRERGRPGSSVMYSFSAPSSGTYYFTLPNNGVTAFIFDGDGNLLPRHERSLDMKASDSCYVVIITDWLESGYEGSEMFDVNVSMSAPDSYWFDDEYGVSYYIHDGIAEVEFLLFGMIGVFIRDEVTDPETGVTACVIGMTEELKEECRDKITFYCTPGGIAEEGWLEPEGFTFAALYPETAEKGDVTGDGKVDRHDALTLQRVIAEGDGMVLQGAAVEAADMNEDGVIDLLDVRVILKAADA